MTHRPATFTASRFRMIATAGIAGICAVAGPLSLPAGAATDPALTLSASSVRPGVPFTVSSAAGCPADAGAQTVDFSFTDSEGTYTLLASIDTDDDGSWDPTSLTIPVVGVDDDGGWQGDPVATGAGAVDASCSATDDDSDDDADAAQSANDDNNNNTDNNSDDDSDDPGMISQTYASARLSVSGAARQLSVTPAVANPGDSVTVTPGEACPAGTTSARISVLPVGADDGDGNDNGNNNNGDNNNADNNNNDPTEGAGAVVSGSAATSSSGAWSPVKLALPAGADTGDYAVTADCVAGGALKASYDAVPIALGTVSFAAPACADQGASLAIRGSYSEPISLSTTKRTVTAPARVALKGDGPWKVTAASATTGVTLASRTVTCPKPTFDLDVPKSTVGATGAVRSSVCNTGQRAVTAILQVAQGGRFKAVDDQKLAAGDCDVLSGGKVAKGGSAQARVLLDAPGGAHDEVAASFSVHRPRR